MCFREAGFKKYFNYNCAYSSLQECLDDVDDIGIKEKINEVLDKYDAVRMDNSIQCSARSQSNKIRKRLWLYRVWDAIDRRCYSCRKKTPFNDITLDHVYPKSKYTNYKEFNNMPCCDTCNQTKDNRDPNRNELEMCHIASRVIGLRFRQPQKREIV